MTRSFLYVCMMLGWLCFAYLCFFFFQAEDGIRDGRVTGVQTCALPICNNARIAPLASLQDGLLDVVLLDRPPLWRIPIAAARLFGGTIHRGSGITMLRGRDRKSVV